VPDASGEVLEGGDARADGGGDPPFEVVPGGLGLDEAVEVSEGFFELPGSPEAVAVSAEDVEQVALGGVEVFAAGSQGVARRPPGSVPDACGVVPAGGFVDRVEGAVGEASWMTWKGSKQITASGTCRRVASR